MRSNGQNNKPNTPKVDERPAQIPEKDGTDTTLTNPEVK